MQSNNDPFTGATTGAGAITGVTMVVGASDLKLFGPLTMHSWMLVEEVTCTYKNVFSLDHVSTMTRIVSHLLQHELNMSHFLRGGGPSICDEPLTFFLVSPLTAIKKLAPLTNVKKILSPL